MHPPLFRPHPECQHVIENLTKCHDENPVAKFNGSCNAAKEALDACFKSEKMTTREINHRDAAAKQDMYRRLEAFKAKKRQEAQAAQAAQADSK